MRTKAKLMLVINAVAAGAIIGASGASADLVPLDDPLHGYCGGVGQCIDNGTNSPTSNNPPVNFGFTVSPGPASGDLWYEILVPNNEQTPGAVYTFTGTNSGTTTAVAGEWTSGNLDTFLGLSASPNNPIGAFLPSTQALDPGATGFSVYAFDAGHQTLQDPSSPGVSPLENLTGGVPLGSYIVGFFNEGTAAAPNWVATANSGAIFVTDAPPVPEASTWAMMLLGFVGLGYAAFRGGAKLRLGDALA